MNKESSKKEVDLTSIEEKTEATLKSVTGNTDALKELTKTIADLTSEWTKWRKAGKFSLILTLFYLGYACV